MKTKNTFIRIIKYSAFFSFLLFLLFTNCKKSVYYYLDNDFKLYFGNYYNETWIFQDSLQGTIDTLKIVEYTNKRNHSCSGKDKCPGRETIEYNVLYNGNKTLFKLEKLDKFINSFDYSVYYKYNVDSRLDFEILYIHDKFHLISDNNSGFKEFDEYFQDNIKYKNVIVMWQAKDSIFWAQNKGIIKFKSDKINSKRIN